MMQELATTAKVGELKDGKHKLALEEKLKFKMTEMGGWEYEVKAKNNGEAAQEIESNGIRVSNVSYTHLKLTTNRKMMTRINETVETEI